jgi:hypothetical protein
MGLFPRNGKQLLSKQNNKHKTNLRMKISKNLCALAIAGVFSTSAYGQTTLYSVTGTGLPFDYVGLYQYAALAFTTTATDYTLTDFNFYGYQVGNLSGNISFSVYSNSSGSPGSIVGSSLGALNSSSLGVGPSSAGSFGLSGLNVALTPSTTYWLVADFSGITLGTGPTPRIWLTLDSTGTPTPSYIGKESQNGSLWAGNGTSFYTGSVTAASSTPVPEASGSVAGIGLAMAGLYQLRRRKAAGRAVES